MPHGNGQGVRGQKRFQKGDAVLQQFLRHQRKDRLVDAAVGLVQAQHEMRAEAADQGGTRQAFQVRHPLDPQAAQGGSQFRCQTQGGNRQGGQGVPVRARGNHAAAVPGNGMGRTWRVGDCAASVQAVPGEAFSQDIQ